MNQWKIKEIHEAKLFLETLRTRFDRHVMTVNDVATYAGLPLKTVKDFLIEKGFVEQAPSTSKIAKHQVTPDGKKLGFYSRIGITAHIGSIFMPVKTGNKLLKQLYKAMEENDVSTV
jgi:hypothetical protein